ncbi:MAG: MerR family transcriptional regulator [Nakamurella sp.]
MSVGEVAGRLGVAPSTVRMWGSRYGLTASARSAGGHRRYTVEDVDRLLRMQHAVVSGTDPAAAAADVLADGAPAPSRGRRGGPGGAVLAVPGAGREVRGLARAASRLDEATATEAVLRSLKDNGTVATWNLLLRPVLVAAGEHWHRTGSGIDVEHLLTQAVTTAFVQYLASLPEFAQAAPVVVAGGPLEDHVLALHAVRAGLAERGVPVRFLGPRTPMSALISTARLIRAPAVLIWMSVQNASAADHLAAVRAAHRRLVLLVGGPGWTGLDTGPATVCTSLEESINLLEVAWTAAGGARPG